MRNFAIAVLIASFAGCACVQYPSGIARTLAEKREPLAADALVGPQADGSYVVATMQVVAPVGEVVQIPGRPVDLAVSPDGAWTVLKTNNSMVFMDMGTKGVAQTLPMPKSGNSFRGIAWTADGAHVWTTEADQRLLRASRGADGAFSWTQEVALPGPGDKGPSAPGGFALDERAGVAYVTVSRRNAVAIVDMATSQRVGEIPVGIAPYDIVLCGGKAYVANWGGRTAREGDFTGPTSGSEAVVDPKTGIASTGTVSVLDLGSRAPVKEIAVGLHPSGMALSPDGSRLYVANANSDTVSVIDTARDAVVATWDVKPLDSLPFGSAPNALAVSPDGAALYVANGCNNCIAVLNTASGRVKGLIPTGWYPAGVARTGADGGLAIVSAKGVGSRYQRERPESKAAGIHGYNSHDHMGCVSFVAAPSDAELEEYTIQAATNMRLPTLHEALNMKAGPPRAVPVPTRPGETSMFRHVVYIIKENRTYDQVFGDMPQGNGEPRFCQFGREVTPNHHALAKQFVLLDNFYCNGVCSADGHQWTDEGYVTDYLEKSFGGFTRSYPFDGGDALAYASSGFIWDAVLRKGLTFRNYGEFVVAEITPRTATWTDIYQDYLNGTKNVAIRAKANLHTLEPHLCPTFVGFPGTVQDVYRAREFIRELNECEATGDFPNFVIMLLPNDHTTGTREGFPTPRASVADNDLALGQIIEALSHSRFWPETAVFVVEDDPQAGLDHVDGRRTVALCVSPYTKRGVVDSTFYNQTSMLRTIELILGLPPLNQMDLSSTPMTACFQDTADLTPYKALPNQIPLDEMNPKIASLRGKQRYYARKSMELPLDDIDQADEQTLNRILWHSVKGYETPYPSVAQRKH